MRSVLLLELGPPVLCDFGEEYHLSEHWVYSHDPLGGRCGLSDREVAESLGCKFRGKGWFSDPQRSYASVFMAANWAAVVVSARVMSPRGILAASRCSSGCHTESDPSWSVKDRTLAGC